MLKFVSLSLTAPGAGSQVMLFRNDAKSIYCAVENKDEAISATVKYQESSDGTTWSDITGTTATISPGQVNGQIVTSVAPYLALYAQGDVLIEVGLLRQFTFVPTQDV
jgi:hypothetical protein